MKSSKIKHIPGISVIVPVYNCQSYIHQCVDSILKQNYTEIEIILIDDGSKDHSGEICDLYAESDSRVKVVHKKNGGVSSARNCGLDIAGGRFVVFVDSDDYVNPDYLEDFRFILQSQIDNADNTYILTDYLSFSDSHTDYKKNMDPFLKKIEDGATSAEQFRGLIFDFRVFPPYCKLYNREVIEKHHIRFDTELKSAEDFDFNIRYLKHMESICYIHSTNYNYRVDYKKYVPSNQGVLGWSEIKSAHIMAKGIVSLAKRMDLYKEVQQEIDIWIAKKHYFNRLPMLFVKNDKITLKDRYILYKKLIGNKQYYRAAKRGIRMSKQSTTKRIGQYFDFFISWWLFYTFNRIRESIVFWLKGIIWSHI